MVLNKTKTVSRIFFPAKLEKKVCKSAYLLVKAIHIGDVLRVGENSRVSLTKNCSLIAILYHLLKGLIIKKKGG